MFAVGLSYIAFIMFRYAPSILAFWRVFVINGCWILSKAFSASIEIITWFLSFNLLIWCITLIDLQVLKNPCILGIKHTSSWCMIFLMCCWILIARILLRIFAFVFISDIGLYSFFVASLSGFGIRVMVACHTTQQSHCWAYTPRKPELKETRVPQCSSQHCL